MWFICTCAHTQNSTHLHSGAWGPRSRDMESSAAHKQAGPRTAGEGGRWASSHLQNCARGLTAAALMESGLSGTDPSIRKLPAAGIKSPLG